MLVHSVTTQNVILTGLDLKSFNAFDQDKISKLEAKHGVFFSLNKSNDPSLPLVIIHAEKPVYKELERGEIYDFSMPKTIDYDLFKENVLDFLEDLEVEMHLGHDYKMSSVAVRQIILH